MERVALETEIHATRRAVSAMCIRGHGVEVGAGSRPFPIPEGVQCFYGDVRDTQALETYFGSTKVKFSGAIDARTMAGIPDHSLDFVISAHVIEHLDDPIGSIGAALRCLKPGGAFLLVAPEMSRTWDRSRPPTTLDHVIADHRDGGAGTRLQAYIEHARYVHPLLTGQPLPEHEIEADARRVMEAGMDLHVHAWRAQDFYAMADHAAQLFGAHVAHRLQSVNETIVVMRSGAAQA
jgi:SAM-dependent methyltransferase